MSKSEVHYVISRSNNGKKPASDLKRHSDYTEAKKEAERLAMQEEATFHVYKLVGIARPVKQPVEFINLTLPGA